MEFQSVYGLDVVQIPTNLPLVREDMTDLVFATERGKFKHVVDEIVRLNSEGRPVLVGTVSIEKSELVAELLAERGMQDYQVLNAKYHEREASIVANAGKRSAITIATNMAGRGTDIKLSEGVREVGGLAIVGTERHESRRIDNQLRGRCGRQGDPGTTRFYVSLEDEVARLFGGDKVKKLLDWFGGNEMDEEPLSQRMVTRTIERAQRQVEEYNFEIRKHLLDYDDVMDKQRSVIYKMRRDVLEDRDVTEQLRDMFQNIIDDALFEYCPEGIDPEEWDIDGFRLRFRGVFGFEPDWGAGGEEDDRPASDRLMEQALQEYERREVLVAEEIRQSYREQIGGDESAIDFPKLARKRVHDLEMMALLRAVDDKWIDHLYSMDYLRESVRLRAYGQKDPLVEYKTEGFELFTTMMKAVEESVAQTVFRLTDPEVRRTRQIRARRGTLTAEEDPFAQLYRYNYVAADKEQDRSFAAYDTSRFALAGQNSAAQPQGGAPDAPKAKPRPIRSGPKVKPNDKCPCGSGKKYKKCCGAQVEN
jgi:preprotein translocase subunit SecA